MLKEIIVVEGKHDAEVVKKAVDAEIIITQGFRLPKPVCAHIAAAQQKRGIIVLTDPDSAGERIRKRISSLAPGCKHAYVSRQQASAHNDIGIEQASPDSVREALNKARPEQIGYEQVFDQRDLLEYGLIGCANAEMRRHELGTRLGIGQTNAKQFLQRLNRYGVTRTEFDTAVMEMEQL